MFDGVHADVIHSSQPQSLRNAAVDKFRSGATWLLIATDVVGRGMDFLGVHTVINYDFPQSTTDYIHRVGRTGRGGRSGVTCCISLCIRMLVCGCSCHVGRVCIVHILLGDAHKLSISFFLPYTPSFPPAYHFLPTHSGPPVCPSLSTLHYGSELVLPKS